MKKIFMLAACCFLLFACNNEKKEDGKMDDGSKTATSADGKKPSMEMLDMSVGDMVKNSYMAFSRADINGMTADYADTVRYTWSNGDSLIGKKAVQEYWKKRWQIIDSLNFSEHIVVPMQANEPQSKYAPTGKWILYWAMVNVKYKNSKKLTFWLHSVNHMNDAGKIDFVGNYFDRHPIHEATKDLIK
ncbi:MAG TPA: nuclear transport factor 2 family protein [Chitinophagaceae bacterium]|nr:nuclear transport factor 2 family protein [Chitinophagaceae bacterium]HNU13594.1 nuclear transport factor 2 family protein [Chitinophagaceae bacterium]